MRRTFKIYYIAGLFCIVAGMAVPENLSAQENSRETEARRLFVEAERLVRQPPCGAFASISILFASPLDVEQAREQLECLEKREKAAVLIDRLMAEYQETEAAFIAAQSPSLSQADISLFRNALEVWISELEQPAKPEQKLDPKTRNDFESVLNMIEKLERPTTKPEKKAGKTLQEQVAEALRRNHEPSLTTSEPSLSTSEVDAIRRQIAACWSLPAGARDAQNMTVQVRTLMNPDGYVRSASIVDTARAATDSFYRSMAESALRAVLNPRCQPLRLPLENYDVWRVMILNFDPQGMF